MSTREVISVLMLSPIYFKLDLTARKNLVREFCYLYGREGCDAEPLLN